MDQLDHWSFPLVESIPGAGVESVDMPSSKLFLFVANSFHFLFLHHLSCAYMSTIATQLVNHDAISTTSSCSSSFMECTDLGNITYPFWGSASCAASPMYVLSHCADSSSSPVYWDMFPAAVNSASSDSPPPEVTSFSITQDRYYQGAASVQDQYLASIQLSWNKSLNDLDFCDPPFSSGNLSQYNIPTSINLTGVPDLTFADSNTFLLFNCSKDASEYVVDRDSSYESKSAYSCMHYKVSCSPGMTNTPCIQWKIDTISELMLQDALDSLSCSHFTFGIASRIYGMSFSDWKSGSIELIWKDTHCGECEKSFGSCIFDANFKTKFNHCECPYGSVFDYKTQTCGPLIDTAGWHRGAKIGIDVALGMLVLGFVAITVRCCGSMIRESLTFEFLTLIKTIIAIAIGVLKKTLKKLQTSSYGPTHKLHAMDVEGLTERPMEYLYSSIASATKSFSSLVGEGGFGRVYKGTLPQAAAAASSHGGLQIAVKVLEVGSKHIKQQLLNEVITLGRIHHVNVVRLLGFCMQEDHKMLVYEYVENGSLDRWLFHDKQGAANQKQVLDWGQRYAIALGIARGLSYLHEECRHRTVHCDIKPQNILLDGQMYPKIADFGLARLMSRDESKVVTLAKGTPGYMAPEFWMGGESQLTTKFDVYSYGMVLLELISGQRNFRRNVAISDFSFPAVAFKAAMQGDLESILDARLGITKNNYTSTDADEAVNLQWKQISITAFVALWCIQDQPASRPCMSDVVKYLEGGDAVSKCPPQPTMSTSSTPFIPQEFVSTHHQLDDFTPISIGR